MNNMTTRWILSGAIFSVAFIGAAIAQTTPPPTGAILEKVAPGAEPPNADGSKSHGSLSDKLDKTNGVIRPSGGVDPKMEKPAPPVGATRVIPPPGGGDAGVQPK